jgi:hypothetical protein
VSRQLHRCGSVNGFFIGRGILSPSGADRGGWTPNVSTQWHSHDGQWCELRLRLDTAHSLPELRGDLKRPAAYLVTSDRRAQFARHVPFDVGELSLVLLERLR